ncbi:MAG: DUF4381 domain-containing protein [Gammaproteobacteria bacterium]
MTPDSLTNRLHDIHELDPASVWPLASGWWLLLAVVVTLILVFIGLRRWRPDWRRYLPRYGWSRHAARELTALRQQVTHGDIKTVATELSELLRRIAIARCGRDHCAGLHGDSWLAWLADHDPAGFDWCERGRLLLDLPYAPPGEGAQPAELRRLIDAARVWTARPAECQLRREAGHGI